MAEKRFLEITGTEKNNSLAYRFLGDALSAQKKYQQAAHAYSSSAKLLPDPEVFLRLARACAKFDSRECVEGALESGLNDFPSYNEIRNEYASFLASQKRWDEAFALLKGTDSETLNQIGILYLQKGDPVSATQAFLTAISVQPKALYCNNLGIAYQRMRRFPDAEKAYLEALRVDALCGECEANLAFLLVELQRWPEAEKQLRILTARNSTMWQARMALGVALESQGKREEALSAYQSLLKEAPSSWPGRSSVEAKLSKLRQK